MGVGVVSLVAVAIAQADSTCWVAVDIEVATVVADTGYLVAVGTEVVAAAASFRRLDSSVVVA